MAASDPDISVGAEMALELHEAPHLGAVDPQVGLDMGGRLLDGVQADAKQLGALLQGGGDGGGSGWGRALPRLAWPVA